jgi:hypothetical protein
MVAGCELVIRQDPTTTLVFSHPLFRGQHLASLLLLSFKQGFSRPRFPRWLPGVSCHTSRSNHNPRFLAPPVQGTNLVKDSLRERDGLSGYLVKLLPSTPEPTQPEPDRRKAPPQCGDWASKSPRKAKRLRKKKSPGNQPWRRWRSSWDQLSSRRRGFVTYSVHRLQAKGLYNGEPK